MLGAHVLLSVDVYRRRRCMGLTDSRVGSGLVLGGPHLCSGVLIARCDRYVMLQMCDIGRSCWAGGCGIALDNVVP